MMPLHRPGTQKKQPRSALRSCGRSSCLGREGEQQLLLFMCRRSSTWTSSSSEQLSGDLSSELQLQRHQGQVITEDDLRDPTMSVKVKALVMWALGLRCPCGVAVPADWLSSLQWCLAALLMLEWYFLLVTSVAVVGIRTWFRLGAVVLFCPPIAAGSSVAASCVGTVDLAFPELRATQVSIRWNLASMLAAVMLVAFIEIDSLYEGIDWLSRTLSGKK